MDAQSRYWQRWGQLAFGLGLTLLFFYMMAPFLVALLLGAVTAIICYPAFSYVEKYVPRFLAALITTLVVALGILLPFIFVLYSGAYRLLALAGKYKLLKPETLDLLLQQPSLRNLVSMVSRFAPIDRAWVRDQAQDILGNLIETLTKAVALFLSEMPGLSLGFLIVILSVYFFLQDGPRFLNFLSRLSPLPEARSKSLYLAFEKSCRGVVVGLFSSSVVQGFIMGLLFAICGLPSPLFIAIMTVVWGLVPVVGSSPIWIGAAIYLFFNSSIVLGIVMLLGGTLIVVSDNVIRSIVMKGQSEMHPLLALVSVFGAVHLVGPTGIFLGPIIAAVFVSFLNILTVA